jgi:hypothetical protein
MLFAIATKMPPLRGWMIPVVCHCYKDAALLAADLAVFIVQHGNVVA